MKTQALIDVTHPDKWIIHTRHHGDVGGVRKSAVEAKVDASDRSDLRGNGPARPVDFLASMLFSSMVLTARVVVLGVASAKYTLLHTEYIKS